MLKVVPDTSVLIDWLNAQRHETHLFSRESVKYLSSVVLMELYAGAFSARDRRQVDRIEQAFQRVGRILPPSPKTFAAAGQLLQRLQWQAGETGRKKAGFSHDVLIALSARQIGATVLTTNARDFEKIRTLVPFALHIIRADS